MSYRRKEKHRRKVIRSFEKPETGVMALSLDSLHKIGK
jgi:hypothetical protein